MRNRTILFLVLTLITTALVAWSGIVPNPYSNGPNNEFDGPYPWNYPAWSIVFGSMVTASLSLSHALYRFVASVILAAAGMGMMFLLVLTTMHSPLAHEALFYVFLGWTIILLFYSGYTLAVWRAGPKDAGIHDGA